MNQQTLKSLDLLLDGVSASDDVRATILAGYLTTSGYFSVNVAAFDAAASEFKSATRLSDATWLSFVAFLVDDYVSDDATGGREADLMKYLAAQCDEYRAAISAPRFPDERPVVRVTQNLSAADAESVAGWLAHRGALRGTLVGLTLMTWPFDAEWAFGRVDVVNCEGGPALVGYLFDKSGDKRLVEATRPLYDASKPIEFTLGPARVTFCFEFGGVKVGEVSP